MEGYCGYGLEGKEIWKLAFLISTLLVLSFRFWFCFILFYFVLFLFRHGFLIFALPVCNGNVFTDGAVFGETIANGW